MGSTHSDFPATNRASEPTRPFPPNRASRPAGTLPPPATLPESTAPPRFPMGQSQTATRSLFPSLAIRLVPTPSIPRAGTPSC